MRHPFFQLPIKVNLLLVLALGCLGVSIPPTLGEPKVYPERWVYVSTGLASDEEVARVEVIARTAAEHGLNGMLLSAGFDTLDLKSPDYFRRLENLKQTCDRLGVEIIPAGFGVGYGGGVLAHDKNLAAALPVHGALFVGANREAHFAADPAVKLANGDFERVEGSLPAEFTLHGAQAAIDTQV